MYCFGLRCYGEHLDLHSVDRRQRQVCLRGRPVDTPAGRTGVGWDAGGRDGFSRAYLHHLDRCGEMLGPMLATIHNLHYYLNLMREVREALDAGRFGAFRAQFKAERARGV